MLDALLTPDDAIHFLALDKANLKDPREALRWLCRSGQLQFTKVGRYVRFRREWLDECVERNRVGLAEATRRTQGERKSQFTVDEASEFVGRTSNTVRR